MPQEKSLEELAEQQLAKLEQLKKDYVSTFSTVAGKNVLADLERKSFMNKTTYSDVRGGIYFHEGQRFVVVYIKNMMKFDLKTLQQLIQREE